MCAHAQLNHIYIPLVVHILKHSTGLMHYYLGNMYVYTAELIAN